MKQRKKQWIGVLIALAVVIILSSGVLGAQSADGKKLMSVEQGTVVTVPYGTTLDEVKERLPESVAGELITDVQTLSYDFDDNTQPSDWTLLSDKITLTKADAVQEVIDLINKIGVVTKDSKALITAAREAYDILPDSEKEKVTNYSVLTAAEKAYQDILTGDYDPAAKIDDCERVVKAFTSEQASQYLAGENTYPELDGYLFAGWYTDEACDETCYLGGEEPSGVTYALFIPEHVLSIKAQISAHLIDGSVTSVDDTASIRFVTSVDSLLYKQVGFEASYIGSDGNVKTATSVSNKVYQSLYVAGSSTEVMQVTPQGTFCGLSKYFKACTITDIPATNYITEFTVRPFWITLDGDKVYSVEATKAIEDGCLRDSVYVSANGQDIPYYGTYNHPYATLDYAITHVKDAGTVRVKDMVTLANDATWTAHGKNITITGDDKDTVTEILDFSALEDVCINDGVTFSDIELTLSAEHRTRIFAEGHKLIVSSDVAFTNETANVQVLGGSRDSQVASTHLELYVGNYRRIYGGSDYQNVTGDTNIIVGAGVNTAADFRSHSGTYALFGAGYSGTVFGNTNVTIQEGATFNYVYGAGEHANAVVKGSTNIQFAGKAMSIYGGSNAGTNTDTHIVMTGGEVEQIFGGSYNASMVGNTDVQVLGGTVYRRVYGGCYNDYTSDGWASTTNAVTGYTSVTFGPDVEGKYAELRTDYKDDSTASDWLGIDDATYYAVSRLGSNYSSENGKETGAFIVNDYDVESNPNKDMAGSTDFMKISANSVTPYHYLVKASSGGEVYSAGDCIYIKPDSGNKATVRLASETGDIVYYAEGTGYYPLPALTSTTLDIYVAFGTEEATDFVAGAEAKIATGEGYAYYETLEQAIVAAEKMENATIENLSTAKKLASITIADSKNGTITTDKKNCIVGETVTLTVTPDEGYNCTGLSVKKDGETVDLGEDIAFTSGTYSLVTEEGNYTVEATFEEKIFVDNSNWDLTEQYEGSVSLPNGGGSTATALQFVKTYTDADLTLTVRDYKDTNETAARTGALFAFDNEQAVCFTVVNGGTTGYRIQTMGGNISNYQTLYNLTEEEITLYTGAEGLDFRMVRLETDVYLYINGKYVATCDLTANNSGVTADTSMTVSIRHYDDAGVQVDIPFVITEDVKTVTIEIAECTNGTVTAKNAHYFAGDTVEFTVTPNEGYNCAELVIKKDGKTVDLGIDDVLSGGTYGFVAEEGVYTVEATFKEKIFVDNSNWDLTEQYEDSVSLPNGGGSTATALQFVKTYTDADLTLTVRDYADEGETAARTGALFTFDNGQAVCFTVVNGGTTGYRIQTMGGNISNYQTLYNLTEEEITLYTGAEGLDFRMVRLETDVYLYINGKYVATCDLTANNSGVTADTSMTVSIRHYDDAGVQVDIPFKISDTVKAVFADNSAWDLSKQYMGVVSLPNGGGSSSTALQFAQEYTDVDLTLTVRDYADEGGTAARTGPLLVFDNGQYVCFTVVNGGTTGYRIQTMGGNISNYQTLYNLTEEEIELYTGTEGLDFRMVRSGTKVHLYINGKEVATCDLTANNSGVTADATMTVSIRHYDDAGVQVDIPFIIR